MLLRGYFRLPPLVKDKPDTQIPCWIEFSSFDHFTSAIFLIQYDIAGKKNYIAVLSSILLVIMQRLLTSWEKQIGFSFTSYVTLWC